MPWKILSSALKSGEDRIPLSTSAFLAIVTIVSLVQWNVATAPTHRIPTLAKQIISAPLMVACLVVPVMFAGENDALNVMGQLYLFNTVLRCIEPIYIAPALYGVDAHLSTSDLSTQLWSCLKKASSNGRRSDSPPLKKTATATKKKTVHSRLYIFVPLVITMVATNFVGSWFATFSGEDAFVIQKEKKALFFAFFGFAVVFMTFAINTFGYALQCIYLFAYGEQEYNPDEWRPLMNHPIIASSLDDLWSRRWHQLFRAIWLAIPFKPVCTIVTRMVADKDGDDEKKKKKPMIAISAASLAVFFMSGLMHEYLAFCGAGWDAYSSRFIGQEFSFFMIHGLGIFVEKALEQCVQVQKMDSWTRRLLAHVWVITFSFATFPLFINSFAYWEIWNKSPFHMFTPFFIDNVWAKYPVLRPFCGSKI